MKIMCRLIMIIFLILLPMFILGQWSSGYLPYKNETTGFIYEGTPIGIVTAISLKGDKVDVEVKDGLVVIMPGDLTPAVLSNLELLVTLSEFVGQSRSFSRRYKMSMSDESIKVSQQLDYLRNGGLQEVSYDARTDVSRSANFSFMVKENGQGTIFIGYKLTEKTDMGSVVFNPSSAIAIKYKVEGFQGAEELEWNKCKEQGLRCVCAYATSNKKYSSQAKSAIRWQQESDWYDTKKQDTKQAYENYIRKYEGCFCIHCDEAKKASEKGSTPPPSPPSPPSPPKPCLEKEKTLIEVARRDKTIESYQAYLDFAQKCVGRFVQEAKNAIQELQPILLDGGISTPDGEGWQILQFRNIVSPAYTPSPGLEVDDTRFPSELILKVKLNDGDNYKIEVSDRKFPDKRTLTVNLNNLIEADLRNDSLRIILTLEKGKPPFVIKLVDLKSGEEAWQMQDVSRGTTTIEKETALRDLNGKFGLLVYEQGNAQPLRFEEVIVLDRGKNNLWIYLIIGLGGIVVVSVMVYLFWRNYQKKQTPWFQNQK